MAKIICPNKQYSGISATVEFLNGIGMTENPNLIAWFKAKGYIVEDHQTNDATESIEFCLESMTVEELKAYADDNEIDLGRASSQEGILKKIQEATEEHFDETDKSDQGELTEEETE